MEKELKRKDELQDVLEFIAQQFSQLAVLKTIPDDLEQREFVVNRALDVRSAAMSYLATSIRHDSTPGGIPGMMPPKTLLIGI